MRIRDANAALHAKRVDEAGAIAPEILRIASLRGEKLRVAARSVMLEMGKPAEVNRSNAISSAITAEFDDMGKKLRKLLSQNGFPENYLDPIYTCSICNDTGKIGFPDSVPCECAKRLLAQKMLRDKSMGLVQSETFDSFNKSVFDDSKQIDDLKATQRAYMEWIRKGCELYANNFPENQKPNLVFSGKSGLGKTFLLNCVGNRLRDNAYPVLLISSYELFARIRDAQFSARNPDALSDIMKIPLLMIDDLGCEPMYENLSIPFLFQIINERCQLGRHLIVSTNLSRTEFEARYTERISSRVFDTERGTVIQFLGDDVRMRRNK